MRKSIFLFLLLFTFGFGEAFPDGTGNPEDAILESSERFFISLKKNDFNTAWNLLSLKSRETIISDIIRATRKAGGGTNKDDIIKDFENSGVISTSYWNAFLNTFNPDMILEECKWEMGVIDKQKAEIIITHRKASDPVTLKVLREDGVWRVGLVETFWAGRTDSFLQKLVNLFAG
ncbi:MAG: hypothetical protein HZA16_06560 [Nitrospirae bacterium]|nr:hypothetical protein [Nitrospirota bacterium]